MIRASSLRTVVSPLLVAAAISVGCATPPPAVEPAPPAPVPTVAVTAPEDAPLRLSGERWASAFYKGETQALWDRFDERMRGLIKSKEGLDEFRDRVSAQAGGEVHVISERVEHIGGNAVYMRDAQFEKASTPLRMSIAFDSTNAIVGFAIRPVPGVKPTEAPTTKLDYETKTPLRLPFTGAWTVAWGGRTIDLNYHAAVRDQRFAYDLLVTREGKTHGGDGTHNTDYFAYNQAIVAPGAGVVVTEIDGIVENIPGEMNPAHPAGNYVVLDHGDGEFSLLAHMIPGSLLVKPGDHVKAGQEIGRCGNSGNSSEPHLHYHLQNTPRFADADGLPAQFRDYLADGKRVSRGEPTRGQVVEVAGATAAAAP
jgi:murein DD-endopeptidase MepM/ murein hydrolase activator NlpD